MALRLRIILFASLAPPILTAVLVTPLFILDIQRGPTKIKACARFGEIFIAVYLLMNFQFLDVKFPNLAPL